MSPEAVPTAPKTNGAGPRALGTWTRSAVHALRLGPSARRAAQFGTFVWLLDASLTLAAGTLPTGARIWGWVASLGIGLLALFPVVLVLHWVLASTLEALAERASEWLEPRVSAAERARVGAVQAALLLSAVLLPVAFAITREVVLEVAQPHFAALVIVAAHCVLLALTLVLWPAARRLGVAFTALLAPTPIGIPLRNAARFLSMLVLIALLAVGALAAQFFTTVRLLPWHVLGSLGGALVLTIGVELAARRAPRSLRAAGLGLLVLISGAGLASAIAMDRAPDSARGAMRESLSGKAGHEVLVLALDFDRDGYLGVLGGGDCSPFNRKRHPSAIDVPDNRIDEDCDGSDLTRSALLQRPRHDWPIPNEMPRQPPVILITIDAFAARHMRVLSADPSRGRDVTPQIEAFAREGTLFRSTFAQGPSTRLSFPSMFTSRWDSQIATRLVARHPFPIEPSELLLAEVMQEAGYDTSAIVPEPYFTPKRWATLLQGFAHVIESPVRVGLGGKHNSRAVTDAAIAQLKANARPAPVMPVKPVKPPAVDAGGKPVKPAPPERLAPKIEKPLFLWAHYFDAHPPHTKPVGGASYGSTETDVYDAELHLVDAEVGRLLREIKKRYGDDALVIITGDHGIGFDSPRHRRLHYGYDLSSIVLQVPLIVRGPLIKAQQLDGLASTMDVAPTIANLLRIRKHLPFEGASLVPELLEGRVTRPQRLHHQFFLEERLWTHRDPLEIASLRTERYNLIHNRLTGVLELYDYRADYLEAHNLIDEPAHKPALATLKQQLAMLTYELHKPKPSEPSAPPQKKPEKHAAE